MHNRKQFLALAASAAIAACGDIAAPPSYEGARPATGNRALAATTVVELGFTGGPQQFVAPKSAEYTVELYGAQGGATGGLGGYSTATIMLNAGDVLHVFVGGQGAIGNLNGGGTGGAGGWNGGGAGGDLLSDRWSAGAGGGGATDIRIGGTGLEHRVLVAGGGGGGDEGGAGGGITGGDGASSWCGSSCAIQLDQHSTTFWTSGHYSNGGRAGTQTAPGIGGTGADDMGFAGFDGALGQGGRGGDAGAFGSAGGGGGGGWYGGGGGAGGGFWSGHMGRGGGGSGHITAGIFSNASMTSGVREGDGLARISWLEDLDVHVSLGAANINVRSKGVVPTSILSTADFDATSIDPATARMGSGMAPEAHARGHYEDVNGDGLTDLVLHFRTQELGVGCGDTSITLTAETLDGTNVTGTMAITVRGC